MNVPNVFNVHPESAVVKLNWTEFDESIDDATTPEVSPTSNVELSVYWSAPPAQATITSPALEFDPFVTEYLKNADEYDPVTLVNMLFDPTILDGTVW